VDPESRLLVSMVPGKRTAQNCQKLIDDVQRRTGVRTDLLYTSDEHAPYLSACGTHRQAGGFRTYITLEMALYHSLGALPEPQFTHRFF